MFASIRIKEMLARVSPSFDSHFASRLRRLVGVFTHWRLPLSLYPIGTLASSDSKIEKKITERLLRRRVRHHLGDAHALRADHHRHLPRATKGGEEGEGHQGR